MEFTLLFAAALGMAGMWLAVRRSPDLADRVNDPFGVLLGASMAGLLLGRLGAMVLTGTNPLTHPADILLVRGGVDTGIATIGALGAIWWGHRKTFLPTLGALSVSALVGLAGWQAGCLFRDACLGTTSDLPWAIAAESGIGRHPTELYAAFGFLVSAWLVSRLNAWAGQTAAAGLILASTVRLLTEPLRPTLGSGATWWYVAGIAVGVAILVAHRKAWHQATNIDTAAVN